MNFGSLFYLNDFILIFDTIWSTSFRIHWIWRGFQHAFII